MSELDSLAAAARQQSGYSQPAHLRVYAPNYSGILAGSLVLFVIAGLGFISASVLALTAVAVLAKSEPGAVVRQVAFVELGVAVLVAGYAALLAMVGSVARAIRHIAQNSFKR